MKKIIVSLGLVVLLSAGCAYADESTGADILAGSGGVSEFKKVDQANTCYFDSQFKKMKKDLCLSSDQECRIDSLYAQYKCRLESLRDRKHCEQQKLCRMIEDGASNSDIRAQRKVVKDLCKDMKEEYKGFLRDVKVQLTDEQKGDFRKFKWDECWKMRKMKKNCTIYTFPCMDSKPCGSCCPSSKPCNSDCAPSKPCDSGCPVKKPCDSDCAPSKPCDSGCPVKKPCNSGCPVKKPCNSGCPIK